jgi:adenylylsulfate kinase
MRSPIVWFFGLPSSGKTTLATVLRDRLIDHGHATVLLDGDALRSGLCRDLTFSEDDRSENIRRAAELALLLNAQGLSVICAFITPQEHHRQLVRELLGDRCSLVHVACPLQVCVSRDVKGLYQRASTKQISGMTGIQDPFAEPASCDLVVETHCQTVEACLQFLVRFLGL